MSSFKKDSSTISRGSVDHWPDEIVAYTDGASRSNPGPASFGLTVLDNEGETIFEEARYLGRKTNNEAEYSGVHRLLELAAKNRVKKLLLKTDSQLIVKQLSGEYKVKSAHLKSVHKMCLQKINQIPAYKIVHVMREQNKRADELANLILDSVEEI